MVFSCLCSIIIFLSHCVVADTLSPLAVQIFFPSALQSLLGLQSSHLSLHFSLEPLPVLMNFFTWLNCQSPGTGGM